MTQVLHVKQVNTNDSFGVVGVSGADLWLGFDIYFQSDLPPANGDQSGLLGFFTDSGAGLGLESVFLDNDSGTVKYWTSYATNGPFQSVATGQWYHVDLRYKPGTPVTEALWIDGVDQGPTVVGNNTNTITGIGLGSKGPNGWETAFEFYIANPTVGTTKGGSEVWSSDLSGGLGVFDSTTVGSGQTFEVIANPTGSEPGSGDGGGGGSGSAGVEVAFGSDSLDATPAFTRIDDPTGINVVTGWRTRRGRSYMTDRTDAGTASASFTDTAGNLDPTNSAGPFYPMDPNCPLRIQLFHPIAETAHTIYTGLVQQVPQTLDLSENFITGTVEAVDLFSVLAISEIPPGLDFDDTSAGTSTANTVGETTYAAADVQDRIKAVLADAGIPSGLTNIFTGNVNVQKTIYPPATQILSVLQDAADAEFPGVANIFISKTGIVTFHGRLARFDPTNPDYDLTTWNVGDVAAVTANPTWSLISGLTFDRDVAKVVNASSMSPDGIDDPSTVAGVSDLPGQLSVDTGSIDQFGNRVYSAANLVTLEGKTDGRDSLEETKLFADYYTANFHDAQTRIQQLAIRSLPADAPHAEQVWDILCGVEISDVVNVTTTHPGGGGFSAAPYFVEGISYEATNQGGAAFQDVTMTLDLSPAAYFATVSHLDGT